jgi:hypothetical protein
MKVKRKQKKLERKKVENKTKTKIITTMSPASWGCISKLKRKEKTKKTEEKHKQGEPLDQRG